MSEWCCRCRGDAAHPSSLIAKMGMRCECRYPLVGAWALPPWSRTFEPVAYQGLRTLRMLRPEPITTMEIASGRDMLSELPTLETVALVSVQIRYRYREAIVYACEFDRWRVDREVAALDMAMRLVGLLARFS